VLERHAAHGTVRTLASVALADTVRVLVVLSAPDAARERVLVVFSAALSGTLLVGVVLSAADAEIVRVVVCSNAADVVTVRVFVLTLLLSVAIKLSKWLLPLLMNADRPNLPAALMLESVVLN